MLPWAAELDEYFLPGAAVVSGVFCCFHVFANAGVVFVISERRKNIFWHVLIAQVGGTLGLFNY